MTKVAIEVVDRRTFAWAVDWPGWCRSGKSLEEALFTLGTYGPRYAVVAHDAGLRFSGRRPMAWKVVEEVTGNATTDFGAPDRTTDADLRPLGRAGARRLADLVAGSWRVLDRIAAGAPPTLRKGPRGGGRDTAAVVEHVDSSNVGYARKLGVRMKDPGPADLRAAVVDALRGAPSAEPLTETGWAPRYAARRFAWHALDHAWEIEDKSR